MATDLQTLALKAIAEAATDPHPSGGLKIAAIRVLRDKTRGERHSLQDLKDAVEWALSWSTQLAAAGLPPESVVATATLTAIKKHPADLPAVGGCPWSASNGGVLTDSQIDALIRDGSAEVLRIGDGRAER